MALSPAIRELLRKYCADKNTGIGTFMREAALRFIGREDLSLAEDLEVLPPGRLMERRRARTTVRRLGARALVSTTKQQQRALERFALTRGWRISHLFRTAALKEAGIAPPKPLTIGRPLGH